MIKELTVRLYKPQDIPRVLDMMIPAFAQLPNYSWITPSRERIDYVLNFNIDNAEAFAGWVLCDSHDVIQGFGGAWCVRSLMSYDMVADDIFMWIEPEYRTYKSSKLLFDAYIAWATEKGARLIRASHTGGSFPKGSKEYDLFDALLRRQGFKEVGSIYHLTKHGEH